MIILIGMPGSGKTSVGRQLARRQDLAFLDTDQLIEQRLGCTIGDYFASEGEAKFRSIEHEVLREVLSNPSDGVLSTGGGAILRPDNREILRRGGQVFYLHALPEAIHRRLRYDSTRPLLRTSDPLTRLRILYAERDALYRETADIVIETGSPTVRNLVNLVLAHLKTDGSEKLDH